jgi:hypothetical protein
VPSTAPAYKSTAATTKVSLRAVRRNTRGSAMRTPVTRPTVSEAPLRDT